ncbi:heat shock protein transcriptional repressor HspR [Parenemella sanctibonifatiensis]|uniref:MerR family transcriptional regulator n=1 Tax=Parenemella sanctibonifatiensis TaxID=2016505 RepID=A0A255EB37_9ACTN|nr:MerR family transcriptional regulator [Parenemella sanctibonifatiensis]OYN88794.1 MerR family transcriptional regulator [Parenemella sanctibonifatiensis]
MPTHRERRGRRAVGADLQPVDRHAALFTISVAARLAGMHPQTLRSYDRMGLVEPRRARGRGRRYSVADIDRLRLIQTLSQQEGVNLQGIKYILGLTRRVEQLQSENALLRDQLAGRAQPRGGRRFTADPNGGVHMARSGSRLRTISSGR